MRNNHEVTVRFPDGTGSMNGMASWPFEKLPKTSTRGGYTPPPTRPLTRSRLHPRASSPATGKTGSKSSSGPHLVTHGDLPRHTGDLYCAPAHALCRKLAKLNSRSNARSIVAGARGWDGHLAAESRPARCLASRSNAPPTLRGQCRNRTTRPSPPEPVLPHETSSQSSSRGSRNFRRDLAKCPGRGGRDHGRVLRLRSGRAGPGGRCTWRSCGISGIVKLLRWSLEPCPVSLRGHANTVRLAAFRSGRIRRNMGAPPWSRHTGPTTGSSWTRRLESGWSIRLARPVRTPGGAPTTTTR